MKQTKTRPIRKMPKQNPNPAAVCPLLQPWTIKLRKRPRMAPNRLPLARSSPTADPSPTGKAISQLSSSMIGTSGNRKKELNAEIKLAQNRLSVWRRGKNRIMARDEPNMQSTMNFLQSFVFRCMLPRIATPNMPEIIGLPPTNPTAIGRSSPPNHGSSRKDSTIDIPLNIPKQHPNAIRRNTQFQFLKSLGIAVEKGSRTMPLEADGGVGGLSSWKTMLRPKQTAAMIASTNITLKVRSFPSQILPGMLISGLQLPNTIPGMNIPRIREVLSTSMNICVTPPLVSAENQFADTFA